MKPDDLKKLLQTVTKQAVKDILERLKDIAKGQGGVVYDIDLDKMIKENDK